METPDLSSAVQNYILGLDNSIESILNQVENDNIETDNIEVLTETIEL